MSFVGSATGAATATLSDEFSPGLALQIRLFAEIPVEPLERQYHAALLFGIATDLRLVE
jgi:hypothetical protein